MNDPTKVNIGNTESQPNSNVTDFFNIEDIYSINTQVVELPSEGKFYSNGKKNVTMKGYTILEENMYSDVSLQKSGKMFDKILESVVMDKDIDWDNILLCDKIALMIYMRKQNEGDTFKIPVSCPTCKTLQDYDVDLSKVQNKKLTHNPVSAGENKFEFVTPLGHTIRYKMLTANDLKASKQEMTSDKKNNMVINGGEAMYLLLQEIVGFKPNGRDEWYTGRAQLLKILYKMPKEEIDAFRTHVNSTEPKLDTTFDFVCQEDICKAEHTMQIPFYDISFFRPMK